MMLLFVPQFSGNFSDIFGPSYLRPRILAKFVIAETPKPMTGGAFLAVLPKNQREDLRLRATKVATAAKTAVILMAIRGFL